MKIGSNVRWIMSERLLIQSRTSTDFTTPVQHEEGSALTVLNTSSHDPIILTFTRKHGASTL